VSDHRRIVDGDIERHKEWLGWQQTRLVAEALAFKGKEELKKNTIQKSRVLWISFASAAAAIFLFFAIFTADRGERVSNELVNLEQQSSPRPVAEQVTLEAEPIPQQVAGDISQTPVTGVKKATIFSIKKRQDPPELTGEKRDTVSQKLKEESLLPAPMRIARLENAQLFKAPGAHEDRIEALDLPALSTTSGKTSVRQLSEKGLRQTYRDFLDERDISLLPIASAGIEGINFLAGSDLSLNLSRDEKGEVSGFRFRGDYLSVDTPVKKAE